MPEPYPFMSDSLQTPLAWPEAVQRLRRRLLAVSPAEGRSGSWQRLEEPVLAVDICRSLAVQALRPLIYWQDRSAAHETAVFGAAHEVRADNHDFVRLDAAISKSLNGAAEGLRYFGGANFDPLRTAPEWAGFPALHFVLPRIELVRYGQGYTLAVHCRRGEDTALALAALDQLVMPPSSPWGPAAAVRGPDLPACAAWTGKVDEALNAIDKGHLSKLVLARRTEIALGEGVDPARVFSRLKALTPGRFHFLFCPSGEISFFGASPERLYRREGRRIVSEALAGTRPRGMTPPEDERLSQELTGSSKEMREHSLVVAAVRQSLLPLTEKFDIEAVPSVARFMEVQHLLSKVEGVLRPGITDGDILSRLHPTPAVAGSPTPQALEYIRALEPFCRGWYAGPVGWVGRDASEFAVAIRSALASGRALFLYAGAGIVRGSDPAAEWDEVEQKTTTALGALT
jgi:menaquinone-specific isochorismate synthase